MYEEELCGVFIAEPWPQEESCVHARLYSVTGPCASEFLP